MVFIRKLKKWWRIEWREMDPSDENYCPRSFWIGGDFPYIHKYPQEELDRRLQEDYKANMKYINEYIDRIVEERKLKEKNTIQDK